MIITRRRRKILAIVDESPRPVLEIAEAGKLWLGPMYHLMRRFEVHGFVTSRLEPRPHLPMHPRRVYSITDAGRELLR